MTVYALDPAMTNIRQQGKDVGHTDGSNLIAASEGANTVAFVSAITQLPCPTLAQDWKQVLSDPASKSYANLRANLNKLEETIEIRNMVRDRNVDFSPSHCSISISS